ncbi:MAG: hypothetical protein ACE5GJ_09980 [Gemmatimonadota bacterium]
MATRWHRDIRARYGVDADGLNGLLAEFLEILTSFLPAILGPSREEVDPLWMQACELFGATAARRGLAAGEVIEEFQILREAVIRLLYRDPPLGSDGRLSLRDALRLNRAIDRGVTHASVGHTDALFYALFEGSGIPDRPGTELLSEIRLQIQDLRAELQEIQDRRERRRRGDGAG